MPENNMVASGVELKVIGKVQAGQEEERIQNN